MKNSLQNGVTCLWFLFMVGRVTADCRTVDIQNIIGGADYAVNSYTMAHITVDSQNILEIGGQYTKSNGETGAFFYIYDYSYCSVIDKFVVSGVNQGIQEISVDGNTLVVLGYDLRNGVMAEIIAALSIYKDPATNEIRTTFIAKVASVIDSAQKSLISSCFLTPGTNIFVFGASTMRQYTTTKVYSFTRTSGSTVASFLTKEKYLALKSINATKTVYTFAKTDSFVSPTLNVAFDQPHNGTGSARMATFGSLNSTFNVWSVLFFHGGTSTTIINRLDISKLRRTLQGRPPPGGGGGSSPAVVTVLNPVLHSATAKIFTINKSLKCLHVEIDSTTQDPTFIMVNDSNQIMKFSLSYTYNTLIDFTISTALSFYAQFSNSNASSKIAYAPKWDIFIFGTTSRLIFDGQIVDFPNKVGFVMGLFKNRINQLFSSGDNALLPFTTTSASTSTSTTSSFTFTSQAAISQLSLANVQPKSMTGVLDKNGWIDTIPVCTPFTENYKSECLYFVFFDSYRNFTNFQNPKAPKSANKCDQPQVFSYQQYAALNQAEKNIRATCYPFFNEKTTPGSIPVDVANRPMLSLDQDKMTVRWNDTIFYDIVGNYWLYVGEETADDVRQSQRKGYTGTASFTSTKVTNLVYYQQVDVDWLKSFDQEAGSTISFECWSTVCPSFVQYNISNFTIWSNAIETNNDKANGTYIYLIEITSSSGSVDKKTLTLVMQPKTVRDVGINIDLPFDLWYSLNKGKISWYAPQPRVSAISLTPSLTPSKLSGNLLATIAASGMTKKALDVIQTWSNQEVLAAYEESLQRAQAKSNSIGVKAKMDSMGILTISFSSPVQIPGYLLREFQVKQKKTETNGPKRRQRRLNVFFPATTFEKNKYSGEIADHGYTGESNPAELSTTSTSPDQTSSGTKATSTTMPERGFGGGRSSGGQKSVGSDELLSLFSAQGETTEGSSEQEEDSGDTNQGNPESQIFGELLPPPAPLEQQNSNTVFPPPKPKTELNQLNQTPSCTSIQYFNAKLNVCEELQIYFGTLNDLFQVQLVKTGTTNETDAQAPQRRILAGEYTQEILSFSGNEIKVGYNFTNPFDVSPNESIVIKLNFGVFDKGLQKNKEIIQPCSRQVIKGLATNYVIALSSASTAATTAAVVGSAILQTVMSGCLAQVWGMINGMQFIIHLPALNIAFPKNAFLVVDKIIMVATFDIPYVEMRKMSRIFPVPTEDEIFFDPEQANLKEALGQLGYESAFMSNNLGSMYIILLILCLMILFSAFLELFARCPRCADFNNKIKTQLHWNFVIRFCIEGILEFSFAAVINIKYGKQDLHILGSWVNYLFAIVFLILLVVLPLFVILFYWYNFELLADESFEKKYGTAYEGLKKDNWFSLLYTSFFIVRRIIFMLISIFLFHHVQLQLSLMVIITLFAACIVVHFEPFEEPLVQNLEVVTETFTLLLINLTFCFTDLIDSSRTQYSIGYMFIAGMVGCIFVHVFFLFKEIFATGISKFKSHRARNKQSAITKLLRLGRLAENMVNTNVGKEEAKEANKEDEENPSVRKLKLETVKEESDDENEEVDDESNEEAEDEENESSHEELKVQLVESESSEESKVAPRVEPQSVAQRNAVQNLTQYSCQAQSQQSQQQEGRSFHQTVDAILYVQNQQRRLKELKEHEQRQNQQIAPNSTVVNEIVKQHFKRKNKLINDIFK